MEREGLAFMHQKAHSLLSKDIKHLNLRSICVHPIHNNAKPTQRFSDIYMGKSIFLIQLPLKDS